MIAFEFNDDYTAIAILTTLHNKIQQNYHNNHTKFNFGMLINYYGNFVCHTSQLAVHQQAKVLVALTF